MTTHCSLSKTLKLSSEMETAALVAPVTAVEFIQDEFLLSGEGPVLTLYRLHPCPRSCFSLSVLQHQRIHGIRPRISQQEQDPNLSQQETCGPSPTFHDLAVFGGKAVRFVRLHLSDPLHLENMGSVMELHDWALDVRWISGDERPLLCVALAHNSALLLDTKSGTPLCRRSCAEGCLLYSALVITHKSWCDTVIMCGTVFNQLVIWKPGDVSHNSESKAQVERRLLGHSGVIFAISYSPKEGIIASASDDRSVRVWQIGDLGGIGGQCGDTNPACLHILYGHQARVFSVKLSCSKIFSAGEDGTCLMWKNGKITQTLKGHRAGGVRALAISSESCKKETWVATGGADGGVRLWKLGVKQEMEGIEEKVVDLKFPKDKMDGSDGQKPKAKQKGWRPKSAKSKSKGDSKADIPLQTDNSMVKISNITKKTENVEEQPADYPAIQKTDDQHNVETQGHQADQKKCTPKLKAEVADQENKDNTDIHEAEKSKTKLGKKGKASECSIMQVDVGIANTKKLQPNESFEEEEMANRDKLRTRSQSEDAMLVKCQAEHSKSDLNIASIGVPKVICTLGSENSTWSDCSFVVCTDKGGVYQYSNGKWDLIWQGPLEFQSYCVMEVVRFKIKGSLVHLCAVGNISGSVQVFPIANTENGLCLKAGNGKIHSLIWQKGREDGGVWLLASRGDGVVCRWWVEVKESENLELEVMKLADFELPTCAKRWLTAAVRVEIGKEIVWVCGDRRGSLLLYQESGKIEMQNGGKEDKLAVETLPQISVSSQEIDKTQTCSDEKLQVKTKLAKSNEEQKKVAVDSKNELMLKLSPASVLFGVHGKQGVTSVFEHSGLFYSTGRDGCVRIFQVRSKPQEKVKENIQDFELKVLRVQRAFKGMEWQEKVLILDTNNAQELEEMGTHFMQDQKLTNNGQPHTKNIDKTTQLNEQSLQEARFAIVGFHGVHFVVWDPVRLDRLLSVECGGGHRSWSLWTNKNNVWTGNGALVFIKQGGVFASKRNLTDATGKMGWTLREGIHGRGIGCVFRLGCIKITKIGYWEVVVTGGEDTSVTILAINRKNGDIKVLAVLSDHISSVRALTAVVNQERCRNRMSALVVSAGGRAQMQCYRLLIGRDGRGTAPACQVIQVVAHRLDEQWERRRNRHKMVKMDPETRYMSMAVLEQTSDSLTLALACSDGAVRLFSVSEVKRHIELLWESFHHQRCVLSVATCCLEDAKGNSSQLLFSAATDGLIAVWDVTSFPSSNQICPSPVFTFPAHQSGVNSLDVCPVKINNIHQITVASGGDDGQLTVSKIKVEHIDKSHNSEFKNWFSVSLETQSRIPLAHAAPLTSLKLLNNNLVISTSCDQRVCLWRVCSAAIRQERAVCSNVADAAALVVWEENDSKSGPSAERGAGDVRESGLGEAERTTEEKLNVDEAEELQIERSGGANEETERRGSAWALVCGQGLQLIQVRNVLETE